MFFIADHQKCLVLLRDAIEHLAWPPTRQRQYLSDLGVAPSLDELALEFDDAYRPLQRSLGGLGLTVKAVDGIRDIDLLLDRMSDKGEGLDAVWDWSGLDGDSTWGELRALALRVLPRLQRR